MNWGWSLAIASMLFMAYILFFVVRAQQNRVELVSDNYYQQELDYQSRIEAQKNSVEYKDSVSMTIFPDKIELRVPPDLAESTGEIEFYYPASQRQDFKEVLSTDALGIQQFDRNKFASGRAEMRLKMEKNGKKYFFHKSLYIP